MALFRIIPAGDLDLTVDPETLLEVPVVNRGKLYVRQKIATRLKFFLGENFRDLREGVPYYRAVLVQNPDLDLVRSLFRKVILSVEEVTTIKRLDVTFDRPARSLAVEFVAFLGAGEVLEVKQPDQAFVIDLQTAA